jgi:hypothetical protein
MLAHFPMWLSRLFTRLGRSSSWWVGCAAPGRLRLASSRRGPAARSQHRGGRIGGGASPHRRGRRPREPRRQQRQGRHVDFRSHATPSYGTSLSSVAIVSTCQNIRPEKFLQGRCIFRQKTASHKVRTFSHIPKLS